MTTFFQLDRPRGTSPSGRATALLARHTTGLLGPSRHWPWTWVLTDVVAGVVAGLAVLLLDPASLPTPALVLSPLIWVLVLVGVGAYDGSPHHVDVGGAGRILLAGGLTLLALGLVSFGLVALQPHLMLTLVATAAASTLALRIGLARAPLSLLASPDATTGRRVLVVGHDRPAVGAVESLRRNSGVDVAGVCLHASAPHSGFDVPVVAGFDHILSAVHQHSADAVVVLPCRHFEPPDLRRLDWHLAPTGTQLFLASALPGPGASRPMHVHLAARGGALRVVKDLSDRVTAGAALMLLTPVLLVLMLAVRLDSPGPALFRQVRVGKDGEAFTMFKLRTMTHDAEERLVAVTGLNESGGVLFKIREDPRVTRFGRLLRRSSLDELPQLLNVLRGHMSLVGPRPPLETEVAAYDADTHRRLAVKPGITGLWQVSGRSDLSWEESVRLDLRYVDSWSMRLDLLILARTARAVLSRRGAY